MRLIFFSYLCSRFRNQDCLSPKKNNKSMEELIKLTQEVLPDNASVELVKEVASSAFNGGKKVGVFISDIIDAIFD